MADIVSRFLPPADCFLPSAVCRLPPAVCRLPPADYHGKSVSEAAAALGIPAGTVKSRTFYALRALKQALEERGLAP